MKSHTIAYFAGMKFFSLPGKKVVSARDTTNNNTPSARLTPGSLRLARANEPVQ